MVRLTIVRFILVLVLVCVSLQSALSQSTTGVPPFATFIKGNVDAINVAGLDNHVTIPIISKAGRGLPFGLAMNYDSNVWSAGRSWAPAQNWGWSPINTSTLAGFVVVTVESTCEGPNEFAESLLFMYADPSGTAHPFSGILTSGSGCGANNAAQTITTSDGSGYTMTVQGSTNPSSPFTVLSLYDVSGNLISAPSGTIFQEIIASGPGSIADRNGNMISTTGTVFTDTLGTIVLSISGTSPNPVKFTYTGPNSATETVTVNYSTYTVSTDFGCSSIAEFPATSESLVSSITLADGSSYSFQYEHPANSTTNVTGRLAQITLPAGGTVQYAYTGGTNGNGIYCNDGTRAGSPAILKRTTSDGTWNYSQTCVTCSSTTTTTTTMTDPAGNDTVYQTSGGVVIETQSYQGSSTANNPDLLQTVITCYNSTAAACSTPQGLSVSNGPPAAITTILLYPSGRQSETVTFLRTNTQLPTEVDQYDFSTAAVGTPGTLLRKTVTAYASLGNILDEPSTVTVSDGSGNTLSQTTYQYDQTSVTATSGTPQQVSITGSRGNATTVARSTNGSSTLSQTFTYFDTGLVKTATNVNGAQATFTYGDCGNSFPTRISEPLSLSRSMVWDCNGSVVTSATNESGNTTTFVYNDPFWRLTAVTDPLSVTTNYTYTLTSEESALVFNSSSSTDDSLATLDGLGRLSTSQVRQAPGSSNFDSAQTTLGWTTTTSTVQGGRFTTTSMPYSGTSGKVAPSGTPVTTTQYDALSRPISTKDAGGGSVTFAYNQNDVLQTLGPAPSGENTKRQQLEYDGLGRLKSSCGIMSSGGYSTCSQNTGSFSGSFTTYSYTTAVGSIKATATRGAQLRTVTYDALGRVTQKVTPEGGTWNYFYDSDTSCPTGYQGASGQLAASKDPNGNLVCYKYDSLNRITGINANGTTCRLFFYDSSTGFSGTIPSGVTTPVNSAGRMAEAATTNCSTTLITDEWFSYDKDGRITDQWELTPNSGQYYHSTAVFYGDGTVNSVQLVSPSLYTMTYGLDGEGRWNALNSGSQKYVTAATFNPSSQPTEIALTGSTPDQDDYVYDPNTGRMTKFTFEVGNTPATMVGQLNWNTNGTLNNLAITDGFNAGGTQTCLFNPLSGMGYDDLGRLVNDDCGSGGWGQTFSYDQFDNLTKTVTSGRTGVSFNPGYNAANNHYASGFGATYDSNGNLTNDTFHTYTWNEFSKLKSVDMSGTGCATSGECVIYDAFGRAVEIDKGSTHTEIWYTQLGKTVFMNGATSTNAYWPTPAGGTENLQGNCPSSCSSYYMHKDWLGSARIVSGTNTHADISDLAFAPYGEIYAQFGVKGPADQMFTGDTQDVVAGTMETPNREYNNSAQGRWLSPDPAGAGWNQYGYPTNPNSEIDPSGLTAYLGPGGAGVIMPDHPCNPRNRFHPCALGGPDSSTCDVDGLDEPCSMVGPSSEVAALFALAGMQIPVTQQIVGYEYQLVPTDGANVTIDLGDGTVINGSSTVNEQWQLTGVVWGPVDADDPILLAQGPGDAANNGNPDLPVLDARTNALAQALRKTNVQALNSPCTIGGFYVASATLGAGGAAVANSEEIVAVASENYPTWLNKFFSWLAGKASNPGPVGATGAAMRGAYTAGKQFCGSF
jgi:RHS repeat-associated protein